MDYKGDFEIQPTKLDSIATWEFSKQINPSASMMMMMMMTSMFQVQGQFM